MAERERVLGSILQGMEQQEAGVGEAGGQTPAVEAGGQTPAVEVRPPTDVSPIYRRILELLPPLIPISAPTPIEVPPPPPPRPVYEFIRD